jgi:hypothetical protein
MLPVVGVRALEGRVGSTLLMQLLGTSPDIAFDARYPAGERRYLSYCIRAGAYLTGEPTLGVTPLFFSDRFGPLPFEAPPLGAVWARALWSATGDELWPGARWYAEKLAVPVDEIVAAGIPVRVVDVVRDPRDLLVSIRAFLAKTGNDGFDSVADGPGGFARTLAERLDEMAASTVDRVTVRYEELVGDIQSCAARLGGWLDVELDPSALPSWEAMAHHTTSASAEASIGRWRDELPADEARLLAPVAERLGY